MPATAQRNEEAHAALIQEIQYAAATHLIVNANTLYDDLARSLAHQFGQLHPGQVLPREWEHLAREALDGLEGVPIQGRPLNPESPVTLREQVIARARLIRDSIGLIGLNSLIARTAGWFPNQPRSLIREILQAQSEFYDRRRVSANPEASPGTAEQVRVQEQDLEGRIRRRADAIRDAVAQMRRPFPVWRDAEPETAEQVSQRQMREREQAEAHLYVNYTGFDPAFEERYGRENPQPPLESPPPTSPGEVLYNCMKAAFPSRDFPDWEVFADNPSHGGIDERPMWEKAATQFLEEL